MDENKRRDNRMTRSYPKFKRRLDLTVALTALFFLWPLMLGVALVIYRTMGRPVIFRQERPGLGEIPFTIRKFRTMRDTRGPDGKLMAPRERITRLGMWLRKTSLDELPQLLNVVRGEMSFVGPRPLLMNYLPYYTPRERRRHLVRPGITGLAQVGGRNDLPWEQRLELDARYVDTMSFMLDLRICYLTILKVLRHEGVLAIPQDHGGFIRSRQILTEGTRSGDKLPS